MVNFWKSVVDNNIFEPTWWYETPRQTEPFFKKCLDCLPRRLVSRPSTKPAWPYLAREPSGLLARVGDGFQKDKNIVIFFPVQRPFVFSVQNMSWLSWRFIKFDLPPRMDRCHLGTTCGGHVWLWKKTIWRMNYFCAATFFLNGKLLVLLSLSVCWLMTWGGARPKFGGSFGRGSCKCLLHEKVREKRR